MICSRSPSASLRFQLVRSFFLVLRRLKLSYPIYCCIVSIGLHVDEMSATVPFDVIFSIKVICAM
jgi:hypothetical protein